VVRAWRVATTSAGPDRAAVVEAAVGEVAAVAVVGVEPALASPIAVAAGRREREVR